jgi:hypothetical protein
VQIGAPVDEVDVVAAFLRGELDSERFGPPLRAALQRDGVDVRLVASPDVSDRAANAYRRALLGELRGWGRDVGLFAGFPEDVSWFRAALTPSEVRRDAVHHWDWWLAVSDGTRLSAVAAERIRRGEVPGVTAEEHRPIVERLRSGSGLPELIVVRRDSVAPLVVLEGHARLTAFALFPDALPAALDVFLGEAPDMERWSEY